MEEKLIAFLLQQLCQEIEECSALEQENALLNDELEELKKG